MYVNTMLVLLPTRTHTCDAYVKYVVSLNINILMKRQSTRQEFVHRPCQLKITSPDGEWRRVTCPLSVPYPRPSSRRSSTALSGRIRSFVNCV